MALTLPYPSLVFVPLDILTADQMNEIVANYEYIANQFPIAASNIDFTTFAYDTTEQVVGKWIDNKTVYCKIVTGTAPSGNASSFNIAHGITDLGAVLPMTNLCLDSGTNASFSGSDGAYFIRFEVGSTNVKIMKTDVAWKNATVRCALYYTKSS